MHHEDGVDESWQGVQHGCWVAHIERLAQLLNGVEELEVVSGLVGGVSNAAIQLPPLLIEQTRKIKC